MGLSSRAGIFYLLLILGTMAVLIHHDVLAAQSANETPYITTADTQLRKGPGAKYDVIQTIPRETRISVVGQEGSWLKVQSKYGRQSGYIEQQSARPIGAPLTRSEGPTAVGAYITTEDVNLRAGAGTQYKALRIIPKDTRINVVRIEGNWLRVESKTGNPPGYVNKGFARKIE